MHRNRLLYLASLLALIIGLGLDVCAAGAEPVAIEITQPKYGFNLLPGSVRRIHATVKNGTTNEVSWTVTGGAKLSSSVGNWVDVTAPAKGSSCSLHGTKGNFSVTSESQFVLTAQSEEDPAATQSITLRVCNPSVQVQVVPFYTTLYAGQLADLQAFVWGAVNRNVNWAITAQPKGGDGTLSDTENQDTVFTATIAGRYTLTAASAADPAKKNIATIYVTGHRMSYNITPSGTMPVDCSVDPELAGKSYEVGPSQRYKTIQSVPWMDLSAGSTVRIHNEDTTGQNPTTYHEYFQVATRAERKQPVRVCGVADAKGNLPVLDANKATGNAKVNVYSAGFAVIGIGKTGWAGVYTGSWTGSQYLIVEGLRVVNANPDSTYTVPTGESSKAWVRGAAAVRIFPTIDTVVRGIDVQLCANGFFADFNANSGFAQVANTLYEGNHLHENGTPKAFSYHQLYIQGWNQVVQFNIIDHYRSGAAGSNLKSRGFPDVIRSNFFGDGAARQLDLVDNQDARAFSSFEDYLDRYTMVPGADKYTGDLLAAAIEAHHADYVYGNIIVNSTSGYPIHYATDMEGMENDRIGKLWFYGNIFFEPTNKAWRFFLFDTSPGGGNSFPEIEWPQIEAFGNGIWLETPGKPNFYWNVWKTQFAHFGRNLVTSNWGSGNLAGGDGTGWAERTSKEAYQGASNQAGESGISNLVGVKSAPFSLTDFTPTPALREAMVSLPADAPKLPVRFQYGSWGIRPLR